MEMLSMLLAIPKTKRHVTSCHICGTAPSSGSVHAYKRAAQITTIRLPHFATSHPAIGREVNKPEGSASKTPPNEALFKCNFC
jgi:hypothetical protein